MMMMTQRKLTDFLAIFPDDIIGSPPSTFHLTSRKFNDSYIVANYARKFVTV
jgi:hypothetical protein